MDAEILERERNFYIRRAKHELATRREQYNQAIADGYGIETPVLASAFAEWMLCARIYTALKKTKFVRKEV